MGIDLVEDVAELYIGVLPGHTADVCPTPLVPGRPAHSAVTRAVGALRRTRWPSISGGPFPADDVGELPALDVVDQAGDDPQAGQVGRLRQEVHVLT